MPVPATGVAVNARTQPTKEPDMQPRIPAISGAEQDVTSRTARKALAYLHRAGVASGIKRGMRRRDRHQTRRELASTRYAY
jgi:hypothetical protein